MKKKIFLSASAFFLFACSSMEKTAPEKPKETAMTQKQLGWFTSKNCTGLQIIRFKDIWNHEIISELKIDEKPVIDSFISRIEKIPTQGEMYKSFGDDTPLIHLKFTCEGKDQTIEIYRNRFKTPSTAFNSQPGSNEKGLYEDIEALLFPELSKKILKIKNLKFDFKDFKITYLGSEYKDYAPVTIQVTTDSFLVEDSQKGTQKLSVNSGQLPPQPLPFSVGQKKFTLNTFHSSKKERLYPVYFEIAP